VGIADTITRIVIAHIRMSPNTPTISQANPTPGVTGRRKRDEDDSQTEEAEPRFLMYESKPLFGFSGTPRTDAGPL